MPRTPEQKAAKAEKQRANYAANRESEAAKARARRAANPEAYRATKRAQRLRRIDANRARERAYYRANAERMREHQRQARRKNPQRIARNRRRSSYGLSHTEYDRLWEAGGGRCPICETTLVEAGRRTHLDHDHATGAARGFLCSDCNVGLGRFKDNPAALRRAAIYVERGGLGLHALGRLKIPRAMSGAAGACAVCSCAPCRLGCPGSLPQT